jgi:AcrR family transcriptional regulator
MAMRRQRATRLSGDQRQDSILKTAERLLSDRGLDDISIEDLATGAGISRPTFYFYFSSKDEVLLALLEQVIREVEIRVASLPRDFAADPATTWRRSIGAFVDVFAAHRSVAVAVLAARPRNAQVHDLWARSMQSWADYTTEVIIDERARGAAPGGIDARDLALSLNLMNERVLSATFSSDSPAIAHENALDVLSTIWLRSIYGRTDFDPAS